MLFRSEMDESRTTLSQGGGDDTARPMDNASSTPPSPPSGPMTRSRAKALHDKVNSFLYMCDLDPTVDGTLPHANALCILRFEPLHRLHGGMKDGREDGQASTKKDHFGATPGAADPTPRSWAVPFPLYWAYI